MNNSLLIIRISKKEVGGVMVDLARADYHQKSRSPTMSFLICRIVSMIVAQERCKKFQSDHRLRQEI